MVKGVRVIRISVARIPCRMRPHNLKGETIMVRTIESLKNRINLLQGRDPVGNQRLINKLMRKIRAMEKETGQK